MTKNALSRIGTIGLCSALALAATSASALNRVPVGKSAASPQLLNIAYSSTVAGIQTELNKAGYDAGPVDGLMGSRTRAAIMAYQRDKGIPVTGIASQGLLSHIIENQGSGSGRPSRAERREERIERLQTMLEQLGYAVTVSGEMDVNTRAAIRAYQRDNGLPVTGRANRELFQHVRSKMREDRRERRSEQASVAASTMADIQRGLSARGYDVGEISGRMNTKTQEAIRQYQQDRGLTVNGEASAELAELLSEGVDQRLNSRETIRAVQRALNAKGYSAGPADGVMGPSTRGAIRSYKQANGMRADSTITARLVRSLDIGVGAESRQDDDRRDGQSSDSARYRTRISEDFNDGHHNSWRVLTQNFSVRSGKLVSDVDTRVSDDEIGKTFLRSIVGQALGVSLPGGARAAAIVREESFGNAFQITTVLSGDPDERARINFGPYQGSGATRGYRLVYDSAERDPLMLLAVTDSGTRRIASTSNVARIADRSFHKVEWTRDPEGEMAVLVDGKLALAVKDNTFTQAFSGFSIINAGGEWQVDEVSVRSID